MDDIDSAQDAYELYCQFAEANRTAMLKVILSPASRRRVAAQNPCMPREEFQACLDSMESGQRDIFLRQLTIGFDRTQAENLPMLKAMFLEMMASSSRGV